MSRGIGEAASGTEDIATGIGSVATVSRTTQGSVEESEGDTTTLSEVTAEMRGLVGRFRY